MASELFQKARPIWAADRDLEMNVNLGFKSVLPAGEYRLSLTCAYSYQLYVNGRMQASGPARACAGYFYVDTLELDLQKEKNSVVVIVAGYHIYSYEYVNQPAFLIAEITKDGAVAAATGAGGFLCREITERCQKVDQYSFQRVFAEVYELDGAYGEWLTGTDRTESGIPVVQKEGGRYFKRGVPYPDYAEIPCAPAGIGVVHVRPETEQDRRLVRTNPHSDQLRWEPEEFQHNILSELNRISLHPDSAPLLDETPPHLYAGRYQQFSFPFNATGFLSLTLEAEEKTVLHLLFDEIFVNGTVDFHRMGSLNTVKLVLQPGKYRFTTFEPYTMGALCAAVLEGSCILHDVRISEFAYPQISGLASYEDPEIQEIYEAAVRTFRHNALDIFMDCPSRERAGWLCDSFFTARTEYALTKGTAVEKSFLQNFLWEGQNPYLPDGMLPMCFPSDHPDHVFIPNWAMWFVLELEEYLARSGDRLLIDALKDQVFALLAYFKRFENSDELLEDLENWVFIEWSAANDEKLVRGVNYPSNMTYSGVLTAAGRLYGDVSLLAKAKRVSETVRRQSFHAESGFYTDNAARTNGELVLTPVMTEVCQYYAFFFGIADPQRDKELWRRLTEEFGPARREQGGYPEIPHANMFIGNYLRLDVLLRYGKRAQVLDEIKGYFGEMARRTGTLWEHNDVQASCNHGFASHVIHWLYMLDGETN